ncbi:MAG: hypothetical protein V4451_06015 [Pseudomonadota bacterium]
MPKPTRTAAQLKELLLERFNDHPSLKGQVTDVHLGGVVWAAGGTGGNWTVPVLRSRDTYSVEVARIIRQVQQQFDLDTD